MDLEQSFASIDARVRQRREAKTVDRDHWRIKKERIAYAKKKK